MNRKIILVIDDQIGQEGSLEYNNFNIDYKSLNDRYKFIFEDCKDSLGQYSSEIAIQSILENREIDLILLDIKFGTDDDRLGFEILNQIKNRFSSLPVAMFTSLDADTKNIMQSFEPGAVSYISKGISVSDFNNQVSNAIMLANDFALIGDSDEMRNLRKQIALIVKYDKIPTLISGERGTGKEIIARYIHYNGSRKNNRFVGLNCAGLNSQLIESELFGHIKGAFTDAIANRDGYFSVAKGGTLFLDEIGELPISVQVSLLRVLQEKIYNPVGDSSTEKKLDIKLICATNANLSELISKGTFRADLFDRIAVNIINPPPLRKMKNDIPILVDYFLEKDFPEIDKKFTVKTKNILKIHNWPGNVRELRNVVTRMVINSSDSHKIDEQFIPDYILQLKIDDANIYQDNREKNTRSLPIDKADHADKLSHIILDVFIEEIQLTGQNAAEFVRNLFPGQLPSKRYLGQIVWKLLDWNPNILISNDLSQKIKQEPLWSSFLLYMNSNPMTKQKLWDKLKRFNIDPPD